MNIETLKSFILPKSWLLQLTDDQLFSVYEELNKGTTLIDIIKLCQRTFKIKRNAEVFHLMPDLVKFRGRALKDLQYINMEEAKNLEVTKQVEAKIRDLSAKLDGVGRLGWLIELQTNRVLTLMEREKKAVPMPITTDNIKLLNDMIKGYVKTQAELGILDQAAAKVEIAIDHKFSELMSNLKDDGTRMIDATHKLLDMAEQKAIIMTEDTNGSYVIKKQKVNT